MYFKVSSRHNPAKGKEDCYYRLVESYRNSEDRVCHRTILNVGFFDEPLDADRLNLIRRKLVERQNNIGMGSLFEWDKTDDPVTNEYVEKLWSRLVNEKRIDTGTGAAAPKRGGRKDGKDWETIDMDSLSHHDAREAGAEWLCFQALEQLGFASFLRSQEWEDKDIRLALAHIISRAVYPASELGTSRWIRENSSVCEITGFPLSEMNKDRLYRITKRLYGLRGQMESYLSVKTDELFDIEDRIFLYDLTNTYFEGRMAGSLVAKHGRSKEKRTDAKLVVLGLVVNPQGFIKHTGLWEGNMADPATLESAITALRAKTSSTAQRATVIIDAGIATDANLEMLLSNGFDYLCVTRSSMKDYKMVEGCSPVMVEDGKKQKIYLEKVSGAKNNDYYLKVESMAKKAKERSMNALFKQRFEDGLRKIAAGLDKKSGVKQEDKVSERIGRLKGKYPSIHRHYEITCLTEDAPPKKKKAGKPADKKTVTSLTWKIKEGIDVDERSGIYFLRTSIQEAERILWDSYNTIREVESTIRCLKSDLDLRPIYHKKDASSLAHLNLGLIAYQVVNTIRYQLKLKPKPKANASPDMPGEKLAGKGIHYEWKEIVRIMNTQKAVTTIAQNKQEEIIIIRKCSNPNQKVKQIYDKLSYRYYPFKKKKFVVHKTFFENMEFIDYQNLADG